MTTYRDTSSSTLVGEWSVERIEGTPLKERGVAFIGFGDDGGIYGDTSVNKLLGSWILESGALELKKLGSTRMAGPTHLMEQESRLLGALGQVSRAQQSSDGWLVLVSESGDPLITASPRP